MSCKGCAEFNEKTCRLIKENRDDNCPCRNCLVRAICVDVCIEYKRYSGIDGEYDRYLKDINKIKGT